MSRYVHCVDTKGKTPNEVIIAVYRQVTKNCYCYEREMEPDHLLNEIGVLRGLAYAMEAVGYCPHNDDLSHFINIQNQLLKEESREQEERVRVRERVRQRQRQQAH